MVSDTNIPLLAFEEITGILGLFGLRRNHRDPDINPIGGGTEVHVAPLLKVDI